jgi:hypothetical protein
MDRQPAVYSSVIINAGWSCGGGILRAEKERETVLVDELRNEANTKEMKEKK